MRSEHNNGNAVSIAQQTMQRPAGQVMPAPRQFRSLHVASLCATFSFNFVPSCSTPYRISASPGLSTSAEVLAGLDDPHSADTTPAWRTKSNLSRVDEFQTMSVSLIEPFSWCGNAVAQAQARGGQASSRALGMAPCAPLPRTSPEIKFYESSGWVFQMA
ncbi:hypothetical protein VTK56DRAFT_7543 [Thermocarpiscus australiensis]